MATITNDVKVFEQMNVPTLGMYEFNNLRVLLMRIRLQTIFLMSTDF